MPDFHTPGPEAPTPEDEVRAFVRSCVRAGLLTHDELHAQVVEAIERQVPDHAAEADELATAWVGEAHDVLREDQRNWPEATDYERLQSAFEEMQLQDVSVLQGCDESAARQAVEEAQTAGAGIRGVAWFTHEEVWHAVDEGVLAITVIEGETATAVGEDHELVYDVRGILEKHGLESGFAEGRVQVDAHWQRPLAS